MARAERKSLLQSEAAQGFALISPTFLYALVLLVLPILVVIAHSFWTQNYLTIDRTFTLENYRIALTEPIYRDLLLRSLLHLAAGQLLHGRARLSDRLFHFLPRRPPQGPVAVPDHHPVLDQLSAARHVVEGHPRLQRRAEFRPDGRSASSTSRRPRCSTIPAPSIITLTHAWAAFAILPIFVSLEKVDRTLIEAATDLGDGPIRRFLRVTLPLSVPGVISALLIVMIPTVGDYVTPRLVGGKDGVMIANAIQAQFGKAANWPLGAALSVTTMADRDRDGGGHGAHHPLRREAGAMRGAAAIDWLPVYAVLYIVFLYLPVIFLPIFSINTAPTPQIPAHRLHAQMVRRSCRSTPALLDAAWNSLIVGVAAAILVHRARHLRRARHHPLPLSRPPRHQRADHGAAGAARDHRRRLACCWSCCRLGLSLSLFTVVLGHVLICIPYSHDAC